MSAEQDRKARAGDYVLGVMSDEERRLAELDLERDAEFRRAVEVFSARMHGLDMTVVPEAVPEGLWDRIAAQIAGEPQVSATADRPVVVPIGGARRTGPHTVGGWRGMAIAASLAAACAIGYFGAVATTSAPQPVVVVVLDTPENVPGAVFEAYADDSVRILPLEDFVVPEGQIMQVWTLYDQSVGPVSLGTIGREPVEVTLKGPDLPRPKAEQLYEITLEPSPGSPTGKPTGPILVKGFAKQPAGS